MFIKKTTMDTNNLLSHLKNIIDSAVLCYANVYKKRTIWWFLFTFCKRALPLHMNFSFDRYSVLYVCALALAYYIDLYVLLALLCLRIEKLSFWLIVTYNHSLWLIMKRSNGNHTSLRSVTLASIKHYKIYRSSSSIFIFFF